MVPISSFKELEQYYRHANRNNDQPYFFILLIKPYNTSRYFDVTRDFFSSIKDFHIHSGKRCDFFMPGYANDLMGAIMHTKLFYSGYLAIRDRRISHPYKNAHGDTFYPITINSKKENRIEKRCFC